jgi:hypothetical protein
MKHGKKCVVAFLGGFGFCGVLPLIIYAVVLGGGVRATVAELLTHMK